MTWLIDGRSIAKKIISARHSTPYQMKDNGAKRECPNCHFLIDNTDVSVEWPGLPVGVKFDPSDVELLQHLSAKCGVEGSNPHAIIDEFISTLDQGICYTHPENLPGTTKDGRCVHFFHKPTNAYASGQRKRRRIQNNDGSTAEKVRWHKTGKTKPITESGVLKGWKKIMVLYKSSAKSSNLDKSNWVMHQYHLGSEEVERGGEYVISKVMYHRPKWVDENVDSPVIEESDTMINRTSPRTPATVTPEPPRKGKSGLFDYMAEDAKPLACPQETDFNTKAFHATPPSAHYEDITHQSAWLAGESQAADNEFCNEAFNYSGPDYLFSPSNACSVADLENLELDTPPDFQLSDLQFSSQEGVYGFP